MPYFTSFGYPGKVHAAHHEEAVLEPGYRRVKGSWAQCVGRRGSRACQATSLVPGLAPPRGGKSAGVTAATPFPPPRGRQGTTLTQPSPFQAFLSVASHSWLSKS